MASSLLSVKNRQKYLKKLGLYTKKVDGVSGAGTKAAYKLFNIIFLNVDSSSYTTSTDAKLKSVYKSYNKSKYMTTDDWKFFKDFKASQFHCTCNGKYCDGYNGRKKKLPMQLIMMAQYVKNYYDKPLYISSSVRCPRRNKEVGGVKTSKHLKFFALDYKVGNEKATTVIKVVKKLPFVKYAYDINKYYVHSNI